uniref:Uncharacterized protein n=1 Tax=Setaria italica TaxID=4555 RepID=K3XNS3_SETIT
MVAPGGCRRATHETPPSPTPALFPWYNARPDLVHATSPTLPAGSMVEGALPGDDKLGPGEERPVRARFEVSCFPSLSLPSPTMQIWR